MHFGPGNKSLAATAIPVVFGPINHSAILGSIDLGIGHLFTKIVEFLVFQFEGFFGGVDSGVGIA